MTTQQGVERIFLWTAIVFLTLSGWWYLVNMNGQMAAIQMYDSGDMPALSGKSWQLTDLGQAGFAWLVMMIAMMVPSVSRALLIYARAANANLPGVIVPGYLFLLGYLMAWAGFSLLMTVLHWQFDHYGLLSNELKFVSPAISGCLLVLAGLYQFSRMKQNCLSHCQSPMSFISGTFRNNRANAFLTGLNHGAYCMGCCWALMLLVFAFGIMSLYWMLAITLFLIFEKVVPALWPRVNRWSTLFSGAGLIFAGFWMLDTALLLQNA